MFIFLIKQNFIFPKQINNVCMFNKKTILWKGIKPDLKKRHMFLNGNI